MPPKPVLPFSFFSKITTYFILCLSITSCTDDENSVQEIVSTWKVFDSKDGLVGQQITALFEDGQRNIWIGTSEGLSVYDGLQFTSHTKADGLLSDYVMSIAQDKKDRIWVGTGEGLNVRIDGRWLSVEIFEGVPISTLIELQSKNVLIGTQCCGVFGLRTDTDSFFYYYNPSDCGECNIVNTLFEDSERRIWIGTDYGLKRVRNQTVTSFNTSDGLSGNVVTAITEDIWGNIWAGTFDGYTVSKIVQNQVMAVGLANLFDQNWVWDLMVDQAGDLWVSTTANGLYKYDGAYMRREFDQLPDERVGALLADSQGNIWIGTLGQGLARKTPN
jgi:ligand-binding sensor domain-containing protein